MRGTQKHGKLLVNDNSNAFHTYTLDWQDDMLTISVDNEAYFTYEKEYEDPKHWPFDQPMYLIMNLAYGGNWGGQQGLDPEKLPQKMEIDYVRVYQQINHNEAAR